jgi:hypothetical protein
VIYRSAPGSVKVWTVGQDEIRDRCRAPVTENEEGVHPELHSLEAMKGSRTTYVTRLRKSALVKLFDAPPSGGDTN